MSARPVDAAPPSGGGGGEPHGMFPGTLGATGSRSAVAAMPPATPPLPHSGVGPPTTAQANPPPPPAGWD